ncbi:diguanylate cyclase [Glaciecola sp. 2405UD65-10]|uniref:diguanylate cyclase n=1 Tax=Glaciecola sp. 2405UD65-10 TaxID=3397244 RepID=UPI003B59973A
MFAIIVTLTLRPALAQESSPEKEITQSANKVSTSQIIRPNNSRAEARAAITAKIDQTNFSNNPRQLIQQLMARAEIDQNSGANIAALQDLQFAFRLAMNTNQQDLVAKVAYKIANIHQVRGEHVIALSYAEQALNRYTEQKDVSNIIGIQLLMLESFIATNRMSQSETLLNNLAYEMESNADVDQKAYYFRLRGEMELEKGNINASLTALSEAESLTPPSNSVALANLRLLASKAHMKQNNMDKAIAALVEAFEFSSNGQLPFVLYQSLQLQRADLLSQLNEYEAAYLVMQNIVKDRLLVQPINEIKRMLDMHANFQLNIQQKENAELKQENEWKTMQLETKQTLSTLYLVVMGLFICLFILMLLLFLRSRKHRNHLEQLAHTDQLTGLHSRARTLELLQHHQQLFARSEQQYCVAILDLDHFKRINDTFGHQVGDKVLLEFGKLCREKFRKSDIVGRIGGEEFLFILPNTPLKQANEVFIQFSQQLLSIGESMDLSQVTTASVGLVSPTKDELVLQIVKRADDALYDAKHKGRNRVVIAYN